MRGAAAAGPHRRCIATGEIARPLRGCCALSSGRAESSSPMWPPILPGRGLWLTPRRDIARTRSGEKAFFARSAPARMPCRQDLPIASKPCWRSAAAMRSGWRAGPVSRLPVSRRSARRSAPEKSRCCCRLWTEPRADAARSVRSGVICPLPTVLTAAELGGVFGRDHVVHVALGGGRLSNRLLADAEKLAGFRSGAVVDRGAEPAAARRMRHDGSIGSR